MVLVLYQSQQITTVIIVVQGLSYNDLVLFAILSVSITSSLIKAYLLQFVDDFHVDCLLYKLVFLQMYTEKCINH